MVGKSLVYDITSTGANLATNVVAGLTALAPGEVDVTATLVDDESDTVDAVAAFVEHVVANVSGAGGCASGYAIADSDGNGTTDTFLDVEPGATVCFDVVPRSNTSVEALTEPRLFRATLQIWWDHVALADERDVYFLVPVD